MKRWLLLSMMLFCASVAFMAASIAGGEGQVGLLLILPFIVAWGPMAVAGAVLLLLAILCAFVGVWKTGESLQENGASAAGGAGLAKKAENRFGGVVMLGPIPIVWGSDERIAKWMLILGIVLCAFLLLVFLVFVHLFI